MPSENYLNRSKLDQIYDELKGVTTLSDKKYLEYLCRVFFIPYNEDEITREVMVQAIYAGYDPDDASACIISALGSPPRYDLYTDLYNKSFIEVTFRGTQYADYGPMQRYGSKKDVISNQARLARYLACLLLRSRGFKIKFSGDSK